MGDVGTQEGKEERKEGRETEMCALQEGEETYKRNVERWGKGGNGRKKAKCLGEGERIKEGEREIEMNLGKERGERKGVLDERGSKDKRKMMT